MSAIRNALYRAARLTDRFHVLVVILISPVFLFPSPSRVPLFLLVPAFWLVRRFADKPQLPRTPLDGVLFVLGLTVCISLVATPDIVFSLPKVAGLVFGLVLYYGIVRTLRNKSQFWWAMHVFILCGAGLAVIALLGTNWLDKVPVLRTVTAHLPRAIRGLPGAEEGFSANAVGGSLLLFIPLQLVLLGNSLSGRSDFFDGPRALWPPGVWRAAYFAAALLSGGVLVLTQSRGAWLALGASSTALLAWHGPRSRRCLAILLLVVAVIVLLGWRWVFPIVSIQMDDNMESNVVGRVEIWSRAIEGIRDFPYTGMGMNMFRRVMPLLYPSFTISPEFDIAHCHSQFLQVALDLGLAGLVAYTALWLQVAYLLVYVFRKAHSPWIRDVASGLGAGLIAQFLFGISDAIPLGAKVGVLFWFDLALAVSAFSLVHTERHPSGALRLRF